MWEYRTLLTDLSWNILVFLPKVNMNTYGIILLKFLWKVVKAVISTQFKMCVKFHDVLHGFCARQGTGVAIMELKMVQDMYSIYQNHFLLLFLDISKAYDMLDRGRFLQTLERYGARKKLCGILVDFWENQYVVTRHSRSYVPPFRLTHSTTWVGFASPKLF